MKVNWLWSYDNWCSRQITCSKFDATNPQICQQKEKRARSSTLIGLYVIDCTPPFSFALLSAIGSTWWDMMLATHPSDGGDMNVDLFNFQNTRGVIYTGEEIGGMFSSVLAVKPVKASQRTESPHGLSIFMNPAAVHFRTCRTTGFAGHLANLMHAYHGRLLDDEVLMWSWCFRWSVIWTMGFASF